jgi:uncharacterized SAM-binding protein YcdF (DUF218 family)
MFFIASKLFELVVTPISFGLLLSALGVALLYTRYAGAGRCVATIGALWLWAIAFGPVGYWLAIPLETRFSAPDKTMPPPDGAIVLGGSVDEALAAQLDRVILSEAVERLRAPVELRRRYPDMRIVFTGGSSALRASQTTEAQTVRRFWRELGLDRDDGSVLYEDRSRNTHENAVFARELVRPKPGERWLLITSAMHMPRSMGIFRRAGFDVVPYPVDFRTSGNWGDWRPFHSALQKLYIVSFAAHEWLGLVAYRLTGRTDALFPGP